MSYADSTASPPPRWMLVAAFATIYLLWGASYLFIRFSVETIPPFVMSGSRFVIGGTLLMLWARSQGAAAPTRANWRAAMTAAVLVFVINNGALVWAAQYLPSGMTALLVGATPLWMVLLDWWRPAGVGGREAGTRPTATVFGGLVLGFFGILLLVSPGELAAADPRFAIGVVALLFGTVSWAAGSLYARGADVPASPILCTGMQLLSGGIMMTLLGAVAGDFTRLDFSAITPLSVVSWVFLIFGGSMAGFASYVWLMRVSTPARVSTYAYINPVIAVFLGWAFAGEALTPRTLIAAAVIISAVMLINSNRHRKPAPTPIPATSRSSA